jgi:phospholipid/cholesterol/gamma-HCH transport system ATP-binding protein
MVRTTRENSRKRDVKVDPAPVPCIEFRDVSLAFDSQPVLKHVSFQVFPAEMKVILGESGGGKSTILKLVLGLIAPDRGKIFIDGEEITGLPEEELYPIREKIGMVFQEGALFDSLTVYENVAYKLLERGEDEAAIRRAVRRILRFIGLPGIENKYPAELSGGMKQRVAIARAVIGDPEIVLFDEPTSGLDPPAAEKICELGLKLRDVQGDCCIWVTHRIKDVHFLSSKYIAEAWGDQVKIAAEDDKLCLINTKFLILHSGVITFEGTDEQMWQSNDPFIRSFLEL